jgi:RNA polymerase sigma-70 factor (ECF subfamily)
VLDDVRLIWRLRQGDREALRTMYEKHRDDLLRLAAGLLRNKTDAEDVVHEVFIAFVQNAGHFSLTGSLKGYLAVCVANKARNVNRARARHNAAPLDAAEAAACTCTRPDEWLIIDEDFQRLRNALNLLPYEQREAVLLRLQGDMKFKHIARHQQTTVKTAISRYRYAINKLRSLLNGEAEQ